MTIAIRSDASGLTLYVQPDSGTAITKWDGTGTPWDTAATTPFRIAMNDTAGSKWTPTAAPKIVITGGGPPLMDGRLPVYQAVDTITESLVIQAYANDFSDLPQLKQLLEQVLNLTYYNAPVMLEIAAFGGTGYYEILSADIQEDWRFSNDEYGQGIMRMLVTWTRSPFCTPASGTTCINAASITNNGNDPKSMTIGGELKYIGQPLNLTLSGGELATSGVRNLWLASIFSHTYYSRSNAISTTSTTGVAVGATEAPSIATLAALRTRLCARVASPTASLQLRAVVTWGSVTLYSSPWVTGGSTTGAFYDFGSIDVPPSVRRASLVAGVISVNVTVQARSTSGTATGTLSWIGVINYFTWAKVTVQDAGTGNAHHTYAYTVTTGGHLLNPPIYATGSGYNQAGSVAGTLPIAFAGSKLWAVWDSAGAHTNTDAITCTATYMPLYRTFVGKGIS